MELASENKVGKGENTDYNCFLLFLKGFQKASFPRVKTQDIVVLGNL